MSFYKNIQVFWYNFMLKKRMKQKQVERSSVSLKAAKRIGILFDGTRLEDQIFIDIQVVLDSI